MLRGCCFSPGSSSQAARGALPASGAAGKHLARWRRELASRLQVAPGASQGAAGLAGQRRPAVVTRGRLPEFTAQVDALPPRGRVVELGFFEDDRLAEVVSFALQVRMSVVVVQTKAMGLKCFRELKVKSMAIEQLLPFQNRQGSGFRERTAEEFAAKCLGLPSQAAAPGRPKYAVNELQLLDRDEGLRDTVFWKLLNKTLVFEDLASLEEYREWVRSEKRDHGVLLALKEGVKVDTSGILDPTATMEHYMERNVAAGKPRLPFCFGSLPQGETDECRALASACELGAQAVAGLAAWEQASAAAAEVAREVGDAAPGALEQQVTSTLRCCLQRA
jgi:hypothetical protein